jgi:hypothetical protein
MADMAPKQLVSDTAGARHLFDVRVTISFRVHPETLAQATA